MPFCRRGEWDEFSDACGTRGEVLGDPSEVIEGLVDAFAEVHTGFALGGDCILKTPKHVTGAGKRNSH